MFNGEKEGKFNPLPSIPRAQELIFHTLVTVRLTGFISLLMSFD